MAQQQKNKTRITVSNNEDMTIPDNAWKAVGSPSRRGSTTVFNNPSPNEIPINNNNDPMENLRRSSIVSETNNWGSFGGFQWEGPSIFDEEGKPMSVPPNQTAPDDILSVPMLPHVSLEPIYRQHRSLSFSMGQDPTFFGYDDYEDNPPPPTTTYQSSFKASLAPMEEEEDNYYDEFELSQIRSRSKSSGAAFGLLSQHQYSRLMNNKEQQEDSLINQRRRSSSRFFNNIVDPQLSLGDKERLRRLSCQQSQFQDYSFPPENNLMKRQSLTLNTQPPTNIQQLADQLENTHFYQHPPTPQPQQFRPTTTDLYTQHLQQQPLFNNYPYYQPQPSQTTQQVADDYFDSDAKGFQDLGKGTPISRLDPTVPLYMVEFKGGRTDFFHVPDGQFQPQLGDLVIVEGDRGKDLGKVAANTLSIHHVTILEQKKQAQLQRLETKEEDENAPVKAQRELHVKRIFRLAAPDEINLLLVKGQDEHKSLVVCQQKTKQRKLPMEVVDAEYQWDRRKLTFYFEAEHRIDFRELVRELFKIYKTRIWMCVVTPPITLEDIKQIDMTLTANSNKNVETENI